MLGSKGLRFGYVRRYTLGTATEDVGLKINILKSYFQGDASILFI
jgi:hypothetical protein